MQLDEYDARNADGHLCFGCKRTIESDEIRTVVYIGPMPIYYHTSCFFGEEKTQTIVNNAIKVNSSIYRERVNLTERRIKT